MSLMPKCGKVFSRKVLIRILAVALGICSLSSFRFFHSLTLSLPSSADVVVVGSSHRQRQRQQQQQDLNHLHDFQQKGFVSNEKSRLSRSSSSALSYYPSTLIELQGHIPKWVHNYLQWHRSQRQKFPDQQLLVAPDAPKLLIQYCTRNCGGLHDRLGHLPSMLYAAAAMQRVLLIRWYTPHPLETFLQPNLINWTVPEYSKWKSRQGFLDDTTDFLRGYRPNISNRSQGEGEASVVVAAAASASTSIHSTTTSYRNALHHAVQAHLDQKVVSLMFWGSEGAPINFAHELKLARPDLIVVDDDDDDDIDLGSFGTATTTVSGVSASPFGHVWHALFRPASAVQTVLDETQTALSLVTGEAYAATHCRVRHPGRFAPNHNPAGKKLGTSADVSGLPFSVPANREMAVRAALRAVQCTEWLWKSDHRHHHKQQHQQQQKSTLRIYFLSDSHDLVEYMVDDMVGHGTRRRGKNETTPSTTTSTSTSTTPDLDSAVTDWKQQRSDTISTRLLVSRDVLQTPATHLDREKRVPKRTHQAAFVDLYLASRAQCLVFGVGNFAFLAAKISGTSCVARHEDFGSSSNNRTSQGNMGRFNQQTGGAPLCPANVEELLRTSSD